MNQRNLFWELFFQLLDKLEPQLGHEIVYRVGRQGTGGHTARIFCWERIPNKWNFLRLRWFDKYHLLFSVVPDTARYHILDVRVLTQVRLMVQQYAQEVGLQAYLER